MNNERSLWTTFVWVSEEQSGDTGGILDLGKWNELEDVSYV